MVSRFRIGRFHCDYADPGGTSHWRAAIWPNGGKVRTSTDTDAQYSVFTVFELLSARSPTFMAFLIFRVMYGVAMGGIWGVASSLAMETIPDRSRGLMSGIFQAGYPCGYLFASVIFGLFYSMVGWRGMFLIGALPVVLLPYIWFKVPESPVWLAARARKENTALLPVLRKQWKLCLYLVLVMAFFNFFQSRYAGSLSYLPEDAAWF